jgi:hypothetical protein
MALPHKPPYPTTADLVARLMDAARRMVEATEECRRAREACRATVERCRLENGRTGRVDAQNPQRSTTASTSRPSRQGAFSPP